MSTLVIEKIVTDFKTLAMPEQLWLIEQLVHQVRKPANNVKSSWESQLATMANDPDIQRQLLEIEAVFAVTETDGLGI